MPKSRIFNVANMSFKALRKNKILAKISEFTVLLMLGSGVVRSLLQLSERWFCHIWLAGRMKFASFEASLGGMGTLSLSYSSFLSHFHLVKPRHESNIVEWGFKP